ncbi:Glycosyltransferase family protein [Pyrodictium delaneyi]|nr:glycosyltransferase family 1 protein [Pyrodictium delaneyi]ALL01990.1 Glycosyltransferase family protein [Pyrodictium delaneyi]
MRVAIYSNKPVSILSFKNYIENVTREMEKLGVEFIYINKKNDISTKADVDLYWYPFSTPPWSLVKVRKPLVISLLGDYGLDIPAWDFYGAGPLQSLVRRYVLKTRLLIKWSIFKRRSSAIITVSKYAKNTLVKHLKFNEKRVFVVYHGVDLNIFNPKGERVTLNRPYFLHVSQYVYPFHNMKNLRRIIAAYTRLDLDPKPYLVLVIPGYPKNIEIDGVILIRKRLDKEALAKLYRGALALVFPSLHETFGMPALEAIASGCPVIASNVTALPEVVGDAAIYVDPYSTKEIAAAMKMIAENEDLRRMLISKGLERARKFTWRKSAIMHKTIFEKILKES